MIIQSLSTTALESIVDCLEISFENYFVKMPSEVDFWRKRFKAARVDYNLSFGAFENGRLIGFIIHGIDQHSDQKTAFNTGTGVIEAYRGRKLVDQMYAYALPILRKENVTKCMLEVIDQNHRAIKVYERIGFIKDRFLHCYKGDLVSSNNQSSIDEIKLDSLEASIYKFQSHYSWDNTLKAIHANPKLFQAFSVKNSLDQPIGYFIINILTKALIQIEALEKHNWHRVIDAVQLFVPSIKLNNVDSRRKVLNEALQTGGLDNYLNQFEMNMEI
ncbi:MAG: GNAT family N-acetyltransferase [Saprospiraceae bacterium]|nr:GNAT family N-acetyltransferase [Saprospiraceae bacterium]